MVLVCHPGKPYLLIVSYDFRCIRIGDGDHHAEWMRTRIGEMRRDQRYVRDGRKLTAGRCQNVVAAAAASQAKTSCIRPNQPLRHRRKSLPVSSRGCMVCASCGWQRDRPQQRSAKHQMQSCRAYLRCGSATELSLIE